MKLNANLFNFTLAMGFFVMSCTSSYAADHESHSKPESRVVNQIEKEPILELDKPIPPLLAKGVVVVPFSSPNIKVIPVYGNAAAQVTPRLGHLHVTLDNAVWHWVHADDGPIVLQGLPAGQHELVVELADAAHKILTSKKLAFVVP